MARYKNIKNGVVIEVSSEIHGDWVLLDDEAEKPVAKPARKAKKKEALNEKPVND